MLWHKSCKKLPDEKRLEDSKNTSDKKRVESLNSFFINFTLKISAIIYQYNYFIIEIIIFAHKLIIHESRKDQRRQNMPELRTSG